MTNLTPERRAEMRRDCIETGQARKTLADWATLPWADELLALLDAADERDRLTAAAPCSETHTEPFDFAYCSTHDRTFALGDRCDYAGLSEVEYLEKQARGQRVRALRAEDERDRLAAAVERVRAIHGPGDIMAWSEDCDDLDDHQWIDDPRGGGMLCADEITGTYCMGCAPDDATDMSDYPYPCATLRALDGTDV